MRFVSGLCSAMGLLAVFCHALAIAEEKQEVEIPIAPVAPAAPQKVRGVPAWSFSRPEKFDITHAATCESRFEGRRVDYKDRGVSELQLRVKLEDDVDAAKTVARPLSVSGWIKNADGTRWDYTLDKEGFKETRGVRVLREFLRDGRPEDRARWQRLLALPLTELTWDSDGNSRSALTADGLLEPLAEAIAIDRQLELLLPPISTLLEEGVLFHQTVRVPSPVPLHGETPVKFKYRVDRLDSGHEAQISFIGESDELLPAGFEWGGIPIPNASIKMTIRGKITRDLRTRSLMAAELEYDLQFSSSKVDFASRLKGRDDWKRKD